MVNHINTSNTTDMVDFYLTSSIYLVSSPIRRMPRATCDDQSVEREGPAVTTLDPIEFAAMA